MSDSEKRRHCGPGDDVGQTSTIIRRLGQREYLPILQAMRAFTERRTPDTGDELWSLEHPPVFTQGLAGKPEHLLDAGDIPVVQTDRGGQITYHGPGQLIVYLLVDIRRAGIGPRALVNAIEAAIVSLLADLEIEGSARPEAPGVYVGAAKIASLGLRIRRGCSYHGLSLNVGMDLQPFHRINPCGYPGLSMVQIRDLRPNVDKGEIEDRLLHHLAAYLGYAAVRYDTSLPTSSPTWDRDHGRA